MLPESTTQTRTLQTFTLLHQLSPNWAGSLILNINLNEQGTALALASNIAGAVCLTLEPDPALLRTAQRNGVGDSHRQHPRRSSPHHEKRTPPAPPPIRRPRRQSRNSPPGNPRTREYSPRPSPTAPANKPPTPSSPHVEPSSHQKIVTTPNPEWQLQTFTFNTPAELAAFDNQAFELMPPHDTLRRSWLQTAPRILHRERPLHRTLWLTDHEHNLLTLDNPR